MTYVAFIFIPVDQSNFLPLLGKDSIPGQSCIGGFTEVPFFTDFFFFKVFFKNWFLAVLGLHCRSEASSGASGWGLPSRGGAWASLTAASLVELGLQAQGLEG